MSMLEKKGLKSMTSAFSLRNYKKRSKLNPKLGEEKVKVRAKENKIQNRQSLGKNNETKTWLFENINKVDKPL